jgi:predicted pyridoxine 5'-phosphate oxidase superfamily flavin-nucleotide-binding protein
MSRRFADLAFTPNVRAQQERHGSRTQYARMQAGGGEPDRLGPDETEFLEQADSFYMATVSETGWPYVQHRGGPEGFVTVLAPERIAFADFRGNLQYVSAGNAMANDRVALIVVDYVHRHRLKLLGHLHFIDVAEADTDLVRRVSPSGYPTRVERIAVIDVAAFDWNCPQQITQRYSRAQVETMLDSLRGQIADLEAKLRELRAGTGDAA